MRFTRSTQKLKRSQRMRCTSQSTTHASQVRASTYKVDTIADLVDMYYDTPL